MASSLPRGEGGERGTQSLRMPRTVSSAAQQRADGGGCRIPFKNRRHKEWREIFMLGLTMNSAWGMPPGVAASAILMPWRRFGACGYASEWTDGRMHRRRSRRRIFSLVPSGANQLMGVTFRFFWTPRIGPSGAVAVCDKIFSFSRHSMQGTAALSMTLASLDALFRDSVRFLRASSQHHVMACSACWRTFPFTIVSDGSFP